MGRSRAQFHPACHFNGWVVHRVSPPNTTLCTCDWIVLYGTYTGVPKNDEIVLGLFCAVEPRCSPQRKSLELSCAGSFPVARQTLLIRFVSAASRTPARRDKAETAHRRAAVSIAPLFSTFRSAPLPLQLSPFKSSLARLEILTIQELPSVKEGCVWLSTVPLQLLVDHADPCSSMFIGPPRASHHPTMSLRSAACMAT